MRTEEEFYKFLGETIKEKRKKLELTNESLSFLTKIDYKTVSQLQNNNTGCNAYNFYKILYILGIDVTEEKIENPNIGKVNHSKLIDNLLDSCSDSDICIIEEIVKIFAKKKYILKNKKN